MEPGQSEAKRLRFNGPTSPWPPASHQEARPVLPPPQPSHHPTSMSPYQSHSLYSRQHQDHPPHPGHHHPDERRHHEQDPYPPPLPPPLQDHRHPPSPAHAPHQAFGFHRRESIVKRESGDEASLPQMRRPNSTGTAPESLPPHPHGPPYSGQHGEEHRRPPSFDNGGSIPASPQVYRPQPPYHAPPTPIAQHNPYEAPQPGYGPQPSVSELYSNLPVASAKRKAQRASQACDNCRQLKAKCDEQRPCQNCKVKSLACVYRDLPTKQPDKVSADILDLMNSLKNEISTLSQKVDDRLSKFERFMKTADPTAMMKVESVEDEHHDYDTQPSADQKEATDEQPSSPRHSDDPERLESAREIVRAMDESEMERFPGPPVNPGQPSLPANHTTLAALLLKWPSIDALVKDISAYKESNIPHINEFPVSQEQTRGVLRVWGRGEGYMFSSKANASGPITDVPVNGTDDSPETAPSPFSDREGWTDIQAWGTVGVPPPQSVDVYKGGVLLADGNPDFERHAVKLYVQSFKDNVLNMHPVLIPYQLDALVTTFLESLPQSYSKMMSKSGAKFVQSSGPSIGSLVPETGSKRKRSPAAEDQTPNIYTPKTGLPVTRSIHSALVLSVLALGKICLHKGRIPELVPDQDPPAYSSPSLRNGNLSQSSPSQGSPPGQASAQASGLPSPKEVDRSILSRRPSLQGPHPPFRGQNVKRNFDVVPGLEYFALAADIFGSHIGGFTLKHVYVALFLGLYHGQLGRVVESWSYIALAGRTLQVVLRPSLSRLSALRESNNVPHTARDNQLAFAFWTCLQLESDILAELPMPHSGILTYEEAIPFPNLSSQANEGYNSYTLTSYQAQLWVRKQLNQVHSQLYRLDVPDAGSTMEATTEHLRTVLAKSKWVPPEFQFSDHEPPANEILAARLRAKYWGSQVILYRKYIDLILHDRLPRNPFDHKPNQQNGWAVHNIDQQSVHAPHGMDPGALNYAKLGISALVESTRAFHGLEAGERILVTNVFTTAHAQWGNLLVLSACYNHDILRQFIDGRLLQNLFQRTIEFFKLIAHSTSPLMTDLAILQGLYRRLGFPLDHDGNHNSSFSSMTSSGHAAGHTPGERHHPGTPNMPPPASSRC